MRGLSQVVGEFMFFCMACGAERNMVGKKCQIFSKILYANEGVVRGYTRRLRPQGGGSVLVN